MKPSTLNIKIGETYPADHILEKIEENPNIDMTFGHILVDYETEKKHKYFVNKECVRSLKTTPIKIYTIISKPSCHNFAYQLIEQEDIKEILENVKEDNTLCCIIDKDDLLRANYKHKSIKKVITQINKVFKANKMTFRASSHPQGIKIVYKKVKEKECVGDLI